MKKISQWLQVISLHRSTLAKLRSLLRDDPGLVRDEASYMWPCYHDCGDNGVCLWLGQSLSRVQLPVTPWTAAPQASLSFTISQSLLKLLSVELMMPSNYLVLCHLLLLLPSIFVNIRVYSNELALRIRWPMYWSFSFSISPSNEYSRLISFRIDWLISLKSKGLSRVFSNTTVQKHQFFGAQLSFWSNSHIHMWLLEKP